MEVVQKSWHVPINLFGLKKFSFRLKSLKHELKVWNKNVFGNILTSSKTCEDELKFFENQFKNSKSDSDFGILKTKQREYSSLLLKEEIFF